MSKDDYDLRNQSGEKLDALVNQIVSVISSLDIHCISTIVALTQARLDNQPDLADSYRSNLIFLANVLTAYVDLLNSQGQTERVASFINLAQIITAVTEMIPKPAKKSRWHRQGS